MCLQVKPLRVHTLMWTKPSVFSVTHTDIRHDEFSKVVNNARTHTCTHARSHWRQRCLSPRTHPQLAGVLIDVLQQATDQEYVSQAAIGASKLARILKLGGFLCGVVATASQRCLLLSSTALNMGATVAHAAHTHYQQSVILTVIERVVTTTAAAFTTDYTARKRSLRRIVLIMMLLRTLGTCLDSAAQSMWDAGAKAVRTSLSARLTKHVLSQDLETVDEAKDKEDIYSGSTTSPHAILKTLESAQSFDKSELGQVIKIPEEIFSSFAQLVSAVSILLGKSPTMLFLLYGVLVATNGLRLLLQDTIKWASETMGLNRTLEQRGDTTESWEMEQVLSNFEDMRVNAKELELLKDMQAKDRLAHLEEKHVIQNLT